MSERTGAEHLSAGRAARYGRVGARKERRQALALKRELGRKQGHAGHAARACSTGAGRAAWAQPGLAVGPAGCALDALSLF